MSKVISADQAAGLIKDGDTIAWTTIGMSYFAEQIAQALETRFLETGAPRNITPVHDCGCGDGKDAGMAHLAHDGLVKRLVCGHTGQAPKMAQMVADERIEAYLLPQGVLATLWRQIAGHKPGVITKVGMGTYVDPRIAGGKVTSLTKEDLVKLIEIEGEEWLLYKSFPVNVAVIRATTADENGNLTVEEEAQISEALPMAQAAHNTGGIVIAQVKYLAEAHSLHPKDVKIPAALVDYVVVAEPENHKQTISTVYNPGLAGNTRVPLGAIPPMPFSERKLIARRAAMELRPDTLVNLGIGVPDGVASVAAEEGVVKNSRSPPNLVPMAASRPLVVTSAPPGMPTPSSSTTPSSTSTTAGAWTSPSWAWPRPMPGATSMSASSAPKWSARAASSTSPRAPKRWCSAVR